MLNSLLEEMTTSSDGACFNDGNGEQYATPFAFRIKSKKVKRSIPEALDNVSYTPEKQEEVYQKHLKSFDNYKGKAERYINVFEAYDLKEIMDGISNVEKFVEVGEKMESELDKICNVLDDIQYDSYEAGDKEFSKKAQELSGSYWKIKSSVDKISQAMGDIVSLMSKVKEKLEDNK